MNLQEYKPNILRYLKQVKPEIPGWRHEIPFSVSPLAQGEYNMNYLIAQDSKRWVFRVNLGTQINREDQIAYEFRALQLIANSGITPQPYYLDDSRKFLEHGLLVMEYLPGDPLDYHRDLTSAAGLFARLHCLEIDVEKNYLIREDHPLSGMYEECSRLAAVYLNSEWADPSVRAYLSDVLEWAESARHTEIFYLEDPISCVINTEVNSGNFIVNRDLNRIHLVDWEKPLYGDPSQDLSHFQVPTTTLWKTDYRMGKNDQDVFMNTYRQMVKNPLLRETIVDRVRLRNPFNCLRGISWSAMAWVQYQTGEHNLCNEDTYQKVISYLQLPFLRSMFDPYIEPSHP